MQGFVWMLVGLLLAIAEITQAQTKTPPPIQSDPYCQNQTSFLIAQYLYGGKPAQKIGPIKERMNFIDNGIDNTSYNRFADPDPVFWASRGLKMTTETLSGNKPNYFRFSQSNLQKKITLTPTWDAGKDKKMIFHPALHGDGFKVEVYTGTTATAPADPLVFNFGGDCKLKNMVVRDTDYRKNQNLDQCKDEPKDFFGKKQDPAKLPGTKCDEFYITEKNCKDLRSGKKPPNGNFHHYFFNAPILAPENVNMAYVADIPILKDYGFPKLTADQQKDFGNNVVGLVPNKTKAEIDQFTLRLQLGYFCSISEQSADWGKELWGLDAKSVTPPSTPTTNAPAVPTAPAKTGG